MTTPLLEPAIADVLLLTLDALKTGHAKSTRALDLLAQLVKDLDGRNAIG